VFRGYRAGTRVSLRIAELGMLGRVISGAARRAQARPEGPDWVVDPDNPARVEACRLAAEDCRRKAEAYAEALGLALGRVRSIREPGVGGGPRPRQGAHFLAAASAVDEVEMPIEAGEVEVRAVVHVVFELAEPPTA
jgi:uncharacterized protein YggE